MYMQSLSPSTVSIALSLFSILSSEVASFAMIRCNAKEVIDFVKHVNLKNYSHTLESALEELGKVDIEKIDALKKVANDTEVSQDTICRVRKILDPAEPE